MYTPKFNISYKILNNIGQIEGAKEVVDNAPLVPSYEKGFRSDAMIRTVFHGTHIEGSDLSYIQTKKILEGEEVYAQPRDIQEVINYRNVVKLLDTLKDEQEYRLEQLTQIHATTVYRVVPPEKSGVLRNTQVIIREEGTGRVIFTPPPHIEVPFLLEDFLIWLNSPEGKMIHPVLRAAIAHYVLVSIHPFVEGNGRTSRAFSNLILLKEGYDTKQFFALEEHFDKDLARYYDAFFKVDNQAPNIRDRDLTPWIEYFTEVMAVELAKIKEKVRKLSIDSRLKSKIGQQVALSERQIKLVEYMHERKEAVMRELKEVVPMVSEDTILRDVKDLMKKGIIEKQGSTKAASYVLVTKT